MQAQYARPHFRINIHYLIPNNRILIMIFQLQSGIILFSSMIDSRQIFKYISRAVVYVNLYLKVDLKEKVNMCFLIALKKLFLTCLKYSKF